jgi:hypothetical protein
MPASPGLCGIGLKNLFVVQIVSNAESVLFSFDNMLKTVVNIVEAHITILRAFLKRLNE